MLNVITRSAQVMAMLGGVVLCLLVGMTCVSILGRGLNSLAHGAHLAELAPALAAWLVAHTGPVTGDYELIEAGIAFAVFAFLPICQLRAGHARVDLIAAAMPARFNRILTAFWEGVLAAIIIVIGWRLYLGFLEKLDNGQTTFLLQMPVWWAYGASFLAALVAGLVGVFCAFMRLREVQTGKPHLPKAEGAEH
ncbi:TRAP transporter small permease [Roseicyclus sp.]|uniref:TRAP transporter small permease n=1 Tax=Roseicyclus sp. TaxID=1914329 RepID=UPI003F6A1D89